MQFGKLSERELKIVDGLDGIEDIRVYEKGFPKSLTLLLFFKVRGQDMYCAITSLRLSVKEFKSFNTMYAFIRNNCPRFVASQTDRDQPVFSFMLLDQQPIDPPVEVINYEHNKEIV